jgi:5-methylcytosine-specific restriction enzyme A
MSKSVGKGVGTARAKIKPSVRRMVMRMFNYTCTRCGATESDGVPLEIDHHVPVARGGTNDVYNLRVMCRPCNAAKSDTMPDRIL